MTSTDLLDLCAWQLTPALESIPLTCYTMPSKDHALLHTWTANRLRSRPQHLSPIQRGLSDILSLRIPELAFIVKADRVHAGESPTLRFYFHGHQTTEQRWPFLLHQALLTWLGLLYPQEPLTLRRAIAASAEDEQSWQILNVSTQLAQHAGVCAQPKDPLLFHALLAHATRTLSGQKLQFRNGHSRYLVPQAANASPFDGLELTAYPPTPHPDKPDHFWTEVITLTTATFPERDGISVLARPSIRNWGPIRRTGPRQAPSRHLDVFLKPYGSQAPHPHSHAVLALVPRQDPASGHYHAAWAHKDSERLIKLLPLLTGETLPPEESLLNPCIHGDGLITLPRLGSGHKDRYLPGGTGVGWVDRADIAHSLDQVLSRKGFKQPPPLQRIRRRCPLAPGTPPLSRQTQLMKALTQLQLPDHTLELLVFQQRDDSTELLIAAIQRLLGPPSQQQGLAFHWEESGLCIQLRAFPAGPLSQQIPQAGLTEDESRSLSESQRKEQRQARQQAILREVEANMHRHIETIRPKTTTLACCILEMQSSLQDDPDHDPYLLSRKVLAQHRILPQVILLDTDPQSGAPAEKYNMAFRDCCRMLGAVPLDELPDNQALAALTFSRKNALSQGHRRYATSTSPLALHVTDEGMRCARPSASDDPIWMPYAEAMLYLMQGKSGRFEQLSLQQKQQKHGLFFRRVLEDMDRHGPVLVLLDHRGLAQTWPAIQNQHLQFDRLSINNHTLRPDSLPNTRLIRWHADPKRIPAHYHHTGAKDVSGFFGWDKACRTFYALKTSPATQKNLKWSAAQSRHPKEQDHSKTTRDAQQALRQLRQLDEICVLFCQSDDKPMNLALLASRLRQRHVQYNDDTTLPFPLHELRLLAENIRSGETATRRS